MKCYKVNAALKFAFLLVCEAGPGINASKICMDKVATSLALGHVRNTLLKIGVHLQLETSLHAKSLTDLKVQNLDAIFYYKILNERSSSYFLEDPWTYMLQLIALHQIYISFEFFYLHL